MPKISDIIKSGIIYAFNDQTIDAPKTNLANTVSSGTTINVYSVDGFYDNWAVQIGKTGERESEIIEVSGTPSGTAINLGAAVTKEHPTDTPVYSIKHNQIVFKSAPNATASATAITNGTITIQVTQENTIFDDSTNGTTNYTYIVAGRSSGLSTNSPDSDRFAWVGPDFYSRGEIIKRAKRKVLNADSISDEIWGDWLNEWLEKMTNTAIDVDESYRLGTTNVSFSGTTQEGTISANDFKQVKRAWYTGDGSTWYQMTKTNITDFTPNETFNETNPFYYMKDDNVIGRLPHDNSGTIGLTFYKLSATLDSEGDTLPQAMRGYTSSFIKYMEAQSKKVDNKHKEAIELEIQAETERLKFASEISNRNKTGPTYIEIVEGMPNDDVIYW